MTHNQSRIIEQYKNFKLKNPKINSYIKVSDQIIQILYSEINFLDSIAITEDPSLLIEFQHNNWHIAIEIEQNAKITIFGIQKEKEFLIETKNINDIKNIFKG